jgi:orotate phosphoribosyltransferase
MADGPMAVPVPEPMPPEALASASIEAIFQRSGALREGHFLLKSGRHSDRYLEKFGVLQFPALAVEICRRFASVLESYEPTLVVGPTTGGVLLAFETARQLEAVLGRGVRGIFAEPVSDARGRPAGRALRRGWPVDPDERVVLVDDILTTGASVLETAEAVRAAGAQPLAAAVIVDRSDGSVDPGFPVHALGRIEIASWDPAGCSLCGAGVALVKPGSSSVVR